MSMQDDAQRRGIEELTPEYGAMVCADFDADHTRIEAIVVHSAGVTLSLNSDVVDSLRHMFAKESSTESKLVDKLNDSSL
ncbi:MAG TPA: hypothetical protein VMY98_01970, partial [Anaerolineae bacterium]|nr:hypothetical protein [Anaerolineae bacterium]